MYPLFPSRKPGGTSIPDGTTVLEQATSTTRADRAERLDQYCTGSRETPYSTLFHALRGFSLRFLSLWRAPR